MTMRTEQINLRATSEQIRRWRAKATELRRNVSDWARLVLDDASVPPKRRQAKKAS